jgi:hypothetical protein
MAETAGPGPLGPPAIRQSKAGRAGPVHRPPLPPTSHNVLTSTGKARAVERDVKSDQPTSPRPVTSPETATLLRVVRFDSVEPDRGQIARLVGLKPGRDNHTRWFELMDQMLASAPRLLRPRGVLRIDQVTAIHPNRLELASGTEYAGSASAFLRHSQMVAAFVVTIGSALERLSRNWLRSGKVMQGTVADAIASEAVEAAAELMEREVRSWAHAQGLEITPRFSPGYCGMHVREQVALFNSVPANRINVRRLPSCLMVPMKSISGLIGVGPADKVSPNVYPCELCDHPDCTQRRGRFDPEKMKALTEW